MSRRFLHISKYKIQFSNKTSAILKGFKRTMCHKRWSCQVEGQKNSHQITSWRLLTLRWYSLKNTMDCRMLTQSSKSSSTLNVKAHWTLNMPSKPNEWHTGHKPFEWLSKSQIEEGMRELSSNTANLAFTDHDLKAERKKERKLSAHIQIGISKGIIKLCSFQRL